MNDVLLICTVVHAVNIDNQIKIVINLAHFRIVKMFRLDKINPVSIMSRSSYLSN